MVEDIFPDNIFVQKLFIEAHFSKTFLKFYIHFAPQQISPKNITPFSHFILVFGGVASLQHLQSVIFFHK